MGAIREGAIKGKRISNKRPLAVHTAKVQLDGGHLACNTFRCAGLMTGGSELLYIR